MMTVKLKVTSPQLRKLRKIVSENESSLTKDKKWSFLTIVDKDAKIGETVTFDEIQHFDYVNKLVVFNNAVPKTNEKLKGIVSTVPGQTRVSFLSLPSNLKGYAVEVEPCQEPTIVKVSSSIKSGTKLKKNFKELSDVGDVAYWITICNSVPDGNDHWIFCIPLSGEPVEIPTKTKELTYVVGFYLENNVFALTSRTTEVLIP